MRERRSSSDWLCMRVPVFLCLCRSQQDTAGERARRQREVQEAEEELRQLQGELGDILTRKHNIEEAVKHIDSRMRQLE